MAMTFRFPIAACAMLVFAGSAAAEGEISSIYDRFKFEKCPITDSGEQDATHSCKMKNGPGLTFIRHEHGINTHIEPAFSEGMYDLDGFFRPSKSGHFGDLYADEKGISTIEWRVEKVKGKWKPFAAIFRTTYGDSDNLAQQLVV